MTVYYNEIDPFAAEWLRALIAAGHIAPGDVDTRSIVDVRPDDLKRYPQCHFFAGIGVWSYALRLAGWPDDRPVWTMSCPCQPFSAAGKGGGFDDERHLWPHAFWLIRQRRPIRILGEQVASKDGLAWLDLVQADMEGEGYAVGAVDTCSAGSGAPHVRQRLRFAAHQLADAEGSGSGTGLRDSRPAEHGRLLAADGRSIRELAVANGGNSGAERQQRGEEQRQQQEDRSPGGLDITAGSGVFDSSRSTGPTNGFWRDADWLLCRDGKWRPVEPRPQQMADGSTESLGRVCAGQVEDIELEIAEWAIRHQADAGKALHDLRMSLSARAKREWPVGGLPGLHETPVLLAFLRQLEEQGWAFSQGVSRSSEETTQARLRMLWNDDATACASRGRGLDEQQSGEPADPMRVLSSILARHAQEAWGKAHAAYADTGFPLAVGARSRVGRLRGYGNAVDAEATRIFIEAYLETQAIDADRHLRLKDIFA